MAFKMFLMALFDIKKHSVWLNDFCRNPEYYFTLCLPDLCCQTVMEGSLQTGMHDHTPFFFHCLLLPLSSSLFATYCGALIWIYVTHIHKQPSYEHHLNLLFVVSNRLPSTPYMHFPFSPACFHPDYLFCVFHCVDSNVIKLTERKKKLCQKCMELKLKVTETFSLTPTNVIMSQFSCQSR